MRKFGRKRGQRKAFLKTLVHNLIMNKKIETTEARAKEIRPIVERFITMAKKHNLAGLRFLLSRLPKDSANKLYYEIAQNYSDRKGGYVRILKTTARRKRDAAIKTVIEFV
jgi:large subunit ribosomal protein L17